MLIRCVTSRCLALLVGYVEDVNFHLCSLRIYSTKPTAVAPPTCSSKTSSTTCPTTPATRASSVVGRGTRSSCGWRLRFTVWMCLKGASMRPSVPPSTWRRKSNGGKGLSSWEKDSSAPTSASGTFLSFWGTNLGPFSGGRSSIRYDSLEQYLLLLLKEVR